MSAMICLHRLPYQEGEAPREVFINPDHILWFERNPHITHVHLSDGSMIKVNQNPEQVLDEIRYGQLRG